MGNLFFPWTWEGETLSSPDILPPQHEPLTLRRRLDGVSPSHRGFMASIRVQPLEVLPFHEPLVRSSGFSRSGPPEGGTPNREPDHSLGLMATIHIQRLKVFPFHKPP